VTTTPSTGGGEGRSGSSRWSWLLPVLTFLAGCLLGGVVVAAGAPDDADGRAVPQASAPGAAEAAPSPSPSDLVVRVPEACLAAADSAQEFTRQVDDVVLAVRDLDARRLQEIVDQVQQSQPELRRLAEQCRSVTGERLTDGQLATSAPAPSPSP